LEFYLNQVTVGSNTYGVQAASLTYFKKPVPEVSLEEAAVLEKKKKKQKKKKKKKKNTKKKKTLPY